tara:strand:- start:463 stop:681 length:219 start_codon:yes stop_codon:yes gene_type:complete
MIKVWLLVMFMHSPTLPFVKYQAIMYHNEEQCMNYLADYLNAYESKSEEYKKELVVDAHCIPFNSFLIQRGA